MLLTVTEQLREESRRADDNERRARDAISRFKVINDARVLAQQDAARANEELRLYKIQLENAQREIFKAQEVLDVMSDQRHEAELSAARARSTARKIKEDRLVDLAREDGRRLGLQQGINRGRRIALEQSRSNTDDRRSRDNLSERSERDYVDEGDDRSFDLQEDIPPPPPPPLDPIDGPMLNFPPSPTAAVPPAHVDIHPIPVRNTPSPSHHPDNVIPLEGFIPHADADSTIRLPPPHEMQRSISPVIPPLQTTGLDDPPLMVPNPGARRDFAPSYADGSHSRQEYRRAASPESPGSTTISQFELVSEPYGPSERPSRKNRRSLSVIPESISGTTTPAHGTRSLSGDGGSPHPSVLPTVPSPRASRSNMDDQSSYVYRRPSYASSSTDSKSASGGGRTPRSSVRSLNHRASTTSTVPDITIVPPSRPSSQTPQATPATMHREFLSAEDAANRPMPPPSSPRTAPEVLPQVMPSLSNPIILPDGQLPPGFIPMGPPQPAVIAPQSRGPSPIYASGGPSAPARSASGGGFHPEHRANGLPRSDGAPTPPALYSQPPGVVPSTSTSQSSRRRTRPPPPAAPAVVPAASLFAVPKSSSSDTDEDEAVASSIASSYDSFTTPPPSAAHARKRPAKRQTYDAAPMQAGLAYPASPLMRPAGASGTPLPPVAAPARGPNANAGMTPRARNAGLGSKRR
ncbi:hypothetical protein BV25DRAFT_1821682 [Artomyces pyxidatus]|uniref:Uncharacterized protein n=1 Tax=Artomyces pyxidatus TaxID=48021 RepID=A0ACB8TAW5_9AGAM|nr:hypothetical protein BV25DRAFT_1821682 [Artomyces pyxidatus]